MSDVVLTEERVEAAIDRVRSLVTHHEKYVPRAMAAYFRADDAFTPQPARGGEIVGHNGHRYVRLSNVNGALAVYRILDKQDRLKRLKRWPKEVAA